MELLFILTGWVFARDGKKATEFSTVWKALGVTFDFGKSDVGLLHVCNTEERKKELTHQILQALGKGYLDNQEALVLRGRLGFADSFVHGRLGKLVLKRSTDHAYGHTKFLDDDLRDALKAMAKRLETVKPRVVSALEGEQFYMYTDACYETEEQTGGLGGVLVSGPGQVLQWFGLALNQQVCERLGARDKGTIIYELELLAAVLATSIWCEDRDDDIFVHFGDNDGVRSSLVRASSTSPMGQKLMRIQLELETNFCLQTWYARVPTEANISDSPSRLQEHLLLLAECDVTPKATNFLGRILETLNAV